MGFGANFEPPATCGIYDTVASDGSTKTEGDLTASLDSSEYESDPESVAVVEGEAEAYDAAIDSIQQVCADANVDVTADIPSNILEGSASSLSASFALVAGAVALLL